jgi:hypothetical protein
MGVHIWLADEQGIARIGPDTIKDYYDFLIEKEQSLPSQAGSIEHEHYNKQKELDINRAERKGGTITLGEKITSQSDPLGAVPKPDQEVWSDEKQLNGLLDSLRKAKRRTKEMDDGNTNWERTFEMKYIALVEFALENGFGITAP